ncbi:hypothetical protein [Variovorax sp. KK3]|uniref:hypothetical protein n=1 Tax=Variovorax sp. KK3 TaxID=1855728 RepID=UPI00097C7F8B|nr:hypothetical protein [Variovorax sp. KK3]
MSLLAMVNKSTGGAMDELSNLQVYGLPVFGIAVASLLVATYRPGPGPYLALSAIVGGVTGALARSLGLGLETFVGVALLFAVVNYPIQLVLDHRFELRQMAGTATPSRIGHDAVDDLNGNVTVAPDRKSFTWKRRWQGERVDEKYIIWFEVPQTTCAENCGCPAQ